MCINTLKKQNFKKKLKKYSREIVKILKTKNNFENLIFFYVF